MNQTHIHLFITHLPIFGSILGGLVLTYGIWAKSNQTKIAAYNIFILSAIGAGIAYLTGEGAEESVENLQGVAESAIHEHEEFASVALFSLITLGVSSLVGLLFTIKQSAFIRPAAFVILFISLISFGLVARTGYLGGKIRHTEINANSAVQEQGGGEQEQGGDKEDDD